MYIYQSIFTFLLQFHGRLIRCLLIAYNWLNYIYIPEELEKYYSSLLHCDQLILQEINVSFGIFCNISRVLRLLMYWTFFCSIVLSCSSSTSELKLMLICHYLSRNPDNLPPPYLHIAAAASDQSPSSEALDYLFWYRPCSN